jgi:hypothetical protein
MVMKRFAASLAAVLLFGGALCTAASAATVAVTVKLPSGAPAKHAFVRMWKMGANYAIVSLETETTNASGSALFKARPGACLKAEYGDDGAGRPRYIGSACPAPYGKTVTINLSP